MIRRAHDESELKQQIIKKDALQSNKDRSANPNCNCTAMQLTFALSTWQTVGPLSLALQSAWCQQCILKDFHLFHAECNHAQKNTRAQLHPSYRPQASQNSAHRKDRASLRVSHAWQKVSWFHLPRRDVTACSQLMQFASPSTHCALRSVFTGALCATRCSASDIFHP